MRLPVDDPDGTIITVNQTFLDWTGYAASELVGRRTFADLLTAGGRIYHETHYAPMLQMQGAAREIALDIVCADGRRLPVLVNAVLERDATGSTPGGRTRGLRRHRTRVVRTRAARAPSSAPRSPRPHAQLLGADAAADPDPARAAGHPRPRRRRRLPAGGRGDEVGGDFYDVFQIGPDDWIVVDRRRAAARASRRRS